MEKKVRKELDVPEKKRFGSLDRTKLCIGAYGFASNVRTEAHIADMAACGIDFCVPGGAVAPETLDLFVKYGIGVIPGGYARYDKTGEENGSALASPEPHPAIVAVDIGDEPSFAELSGAASAADAVAKTHPGLMPYLHLLPIYASEEKLGQKGADGYRNYVDGYLKALGDKTDYICYDNYMYSANPGLAFENLLIASEACRKAGKDLRVVLQANSSDPEDEMHIGQLYFQALVALAFGARAIGWACWSADRWANNVLDAQGNKTAVYDRLRTVNEALHALSPDYMRYRHVETRLLGHTELPHYKTFSMRPTYAFSIGPFRQIGIDNHCGALVGHFEGEDGSVMLLITDVSNPCGMERTALGSAASMDNFLCVYCKTDDAYDYTVSYGGREEPATFEEGFLAVEISTRVSKGVPCKMLIARPKKQNDGKGEHAV